MSGDDWITASRAGYRTSLSPRPSSLLPSAVPAHQFADLDGVFLLPPRQLPLPRLVRPPERALVLSLRLRRRERRLLLRASRHAQFLHLHEEAPAFRLERVARHARQAALGHLSRRSADWSGLERIGADWSRSERIGTYWIGSEWIGADRSRTDLSGLEPIGADQSRSEQIGSERIGADLTSILRVHSTSNKYLVIRLDLRANWISPQTGRVGIAANQTESSAPPCP